jgi:hypothetical protein
MIKINTKKSLYVSLLMLIVSCNTIDVTGRKVSGRLVNGNLEGEGIIYSPYGGVDLEGTFKDGKLNGKGKR